MRSHISRIVLITCVVCVASMQFASASSANVEATAIDGRERSFCTVLSNGTVKCWGANTYGETGTGDTKHTPWPTTVAGVDDAVDIGVGRGFSCALHTDGGVSCWGRNSSGQLGNGSTEDFLAPQMVTGLSGATKIAVGDSHVCALTEGQVKCWGSNHQSALGVDSISHSSTPLTVAGLSGVTSIGSGDYFSCASLDTGVAKCWGNNIYGKLGSSTFHDPYSSVPQVVTGINTASEVFVGTDWACARKVDQSVACWSAVLPGKPAVPMPDPPLTVTQLSGATAVVGSHDVICAALAGGSAWCAGSQPYGVLGNGVDKGNDIRAWDQSPKIPWLSGVKSIATDGLSTCAISSGGEIQCWGYNAQGQLGNGEMQTDYSPRDVQGVGDAMSAASGEAHNCAVITDATLRCWGAGGSGQLGVFLPTDVRYTSTPVHPGGADGATSVDAGGLSSCITWQDFVRCFGGVLGGTAPEKVEDSEGSTQVSVGGVHACAIADGIPLCWGNNSRQQLGDSDVSYSTDAIPAAGVEDATAVAAGTESTCALVEDGAAVCWGSRQEGALGNGVNENSSTASTVNVNGVVGASAIASGYKHTCVIVSSALKCWGSNSHGQRGLDGDPSGQPVDVDAGAPVEAVATGRNHTCALVTGGTVNCWGSNAEGQLGDGTGKDSSEPVEVVGIAGATAISAGSTHNCAVIADGSVKCWGDGAGGKTGIPYGDFYLNPVKLAGIGNYVPPVVLLPGGNNEVPSLAKPQLKLKAQRPARKVRISYSCVTRCTARITLKIAGKTTKLALRSLSSNTSGTATFSVPAKVLRSWRLAKKRNRRVVLRVVLTDTHGSSSTVSRTMR